MTTRTEAGIPGMTTGERAIDPVHSEVGFAVRHMMVGKVRGRFRTFAGTVVTSPDPADVTVTATIDLTSIDTGNQRRDDHLRSADFFDASRNPTMRYQGKGLHRVDGEWMLVGHLTLNGITRAVLLAVECNGFGADPAIGQVVGFSATGNLNRRDFGITFDIPLADGGGVIGDRITIQLEIEAAHHNMPTGD
jgi:polyisoprenoid-binding protein YceI